MVEFILVLGYWAARFEYLSDVLFWRLVFWNGGSFVWCSSCQS